MFNLIILFILTGELQTIETKNTFNFLSVNPKHSLPDGIPKHDPIKTKAPPVQDLRKNEAVETSIFTGKKTKSQSEQPLFQILFSTLFLKSTFLKSIKMLTSG